MTTISVSPNDMEKIKKFKVEVDPFGILGIQVVVNPVLPDNCIVMTTPCPSGRYGCGKPNCLGGKHFEVIFVDNGASDVRITKFKLE